MAAFPVAKLAALLLKQLSKPIANYAKERAKTHPFFRRHICMPPAQIYNWCEVKMKMWVMNMGKPVEIPQLNETMAIELGANLLGETIIFSIAAILLFLEYSRQVRKEAKKEEARLKELSDLTGAIQDIYFQTDKQAAQLREMQRQVVDLESKLHKALHRPFGPQNPPPPGGPELTSYQIPENQSNFPVTNLKYSGVVLRALDYVTYQIPNGYYR